MKRLDFVFVYFCFLFLFLMYNVLGNDEGTERW